MGCAGSKTKGSPLPADSDGVASVTYTPGLGSMVGVGARFAVGNPSQAPAPVFAVDDFALHAVQAAEQAAGFPDLPLMQQLPYARGADHFVVHGERIHPIDVEAFGFAELGEDFGRPSAAPCRG